MDSTVEMSTRTFRGSQVTSIAIATFVGMQVMTASILVGLHVLLVVPLFIGAVVVALGFLAGDTRVVLDDEGLHVTWRALAARYTGASPRERHLDWSRIASFQLDSEMSRSLEEYDFLRIDFTGPRDRLVLTDRQDRPGFERFRDAFLARVEAGERRAAASASEPAHSEPTREIRRRRGFYRSPVAHVLTLLFVGLSVALALMAMAGMLGPTHLFRLAAVIAPGTAYMVWRTWLRPD